MMGFVLLPLPEIEYLYGRQQCPIFSPTVFTVFLNVFPTKRKSIDKKERLLMESAYFKSINAKKLVDKHSKFMMLSSDKLINVEEAE